MKKFTLKDVIKQMEDFYKKRQQQAIDLEFSTGYNDELGNGLLDFIEPSMNAYDGRAFKHLHLDEIGLWNSPVNLGRLGTTIIKPQRMIIIKDV